MINEEYMNYWLTTMEDLGLLESLLQTNISNYLRTKNLKELEYALENITEIQRITPLKIEYYNKIFTQNLENNYREIKRQRKN